MDFDGKKSPPSAVAELENRNFWRGVIAFLIILLGAGAVVSAFLILDEQLFAKNSRFTLRNFDVRVAVGSLGSRWMTPAGSAELGEWMGLVKDQSNIFALDLSSLRMRAEAFCPGIERIEVARVLPDTIQARVFERVPMAVVEPWINDYVRETEFLVPVGNRGPGARDRVKALFVGADTTVMSDRDCGDARVELLPHIIVYANAPRLALGEKMPLMKWPLALLSEVKKRPANLKVLTIDMRDSGSRFAMHQFHPVEFLYADQYRGIAIMPPDNIARNLDVLEMMIRQTLEEVGSLPDDCVYNVDKQIKQNKKDLDLK